MNVDPTRPDPIRPNRIGGEEHGRRTGGTRSAESFDALLKKQVEGGSDPAVRLSAHAQARLAGQGVHLGPVDLGRVANAVDRLEAKGSRESLVVYRDVGLVVNIKNRTVLTALDRSRMKSGIVTGIDSTVFVEEEEKNVDSP